MLKLGIIGMSEGNGHPYSWSAIINGSYDPVLMQDCGFPVIPAYLAGNSDTLGIDGAKVTRVWCKEGVELAQKVARASHIEAAVEKMEDMIGQVDAVLIARDDPENHVVMAKPFIEAGVPVFIDKPLAFSREDLNYFTSQVQAGKFIMSSSALRYSAGVQANREKIKNLGQIRLCVATGPKYLRTYAIHYLEGMFSLLGDPQALRVQHIGTDGRNTIRVELANGAEAFVHVIKDITAGELNVYGTAGHVSVDHGGSYTCFRAQLVEFVRSLQAGKPRTDFKITHNLINTLVGARESMNAGGKIIELTEYAL